MKAAKILALACVMAASCAQARVVTDDNGTAVDVPDNIRRVVVTNIFPMAAAVTAYTGSGATVVGMHPASRSAAVNGLLGELFPEVAQADATFMSGNNLNVESVMALNPDVVLVNAPDKRQLERLRAAGLPAFAVSATKWDYDLDKTFDAWLADLAKLFPNAKVKPEAVKAAAGRLEKLVADRLANLKDNEKPRVLFLVRLSPTEIVTSGRHFFGHGWAQATGAKNVTDNITKADANATVTMEDIHAADPDAIFLTNFTTALPEDLIENRMPGRDWSDLKAVQGKKVYKMPLGLYRSFTPSLDSPVTRLWMAATLHPALFKDVDVKAEAAKFYKDAFGLSLTNAQLESIFSPHRNAGRNAARAR